MNDREAFDGWWSWPADEWQRRRLMDPSDMAYEVWQAATAAEREQCAKVCEAFVGGTFFAAAIRRGTTP